MQMSEILNRIHISNKAICDNIDASNVFGRGLTSQNILSQLRNLLEAINMYFFANNEDIEYTYENIEKANAYIKANARLRLLSKFHHLLQISASHYTLEQDCSERLMLKYYEYLINIKHLMKSYGIDILNNLNKFPINTDCTLQIFYEKISEKIENPSFLRKENEYSDRYYIQKITPFFVNQNIYYEITFILANDYASKFDRIIAFSKHNILDNYAVKLNIHTEYIDILNYSMPILIIDDWEIAIRQCEINHFSDIFENNLQINTNTKSFKYLMAYLKDQHLNLLEFILLPDYIAEKSKIIESYGVSKFFDILDKSREIILKSSYGCNVLRYLLYTLNNRIIKLQLNDSSCNLLSDLYLTPQSIPFDRMPFCSSLKGHNPSIYNLLFCIDYESKEHELFARFIKNNSEQNASLYYSLQDAPVETKNIDNLISKYNNSLYSGHRPLRQLEKFKDFVFLNEYEYNVYNIIKKLKELSSLKITGYTEATKMWIDENPNTIDCPEKKEYLIKMFNNSTVSLIYGPAGTGKSTLIKHISSRFADYPKIYLANTNPAVDNLKRKVNIPKSEFMTIAKFLSLPYENTCTLLFIDECSTVCNSDMLKILDKTKFDLLVLVGDIYQIESIIFGNWFSLAKYFLKKDSICELTKPYRTDNKELLKLWNSVRELNGDIAEIMARNSYSHPLDDSVFNSSDDDEIILCLNYDGLYGINNINKFLQVANPNEAIVWAGQTYKINDPILFNETKRFGSLIYNNFKGKITKIQKEEEKIYFEIEINKTISALEAQFNNLEYVKNSDNGNSIIRFHVNKYKNQDDDNELSAENIVPFQIAYAVSIHKSQGLEYNSVKIVLTEEVDEQVSHNIFYTAITRAREKLKIFWSPETQQKILANFKLKQYARDASILKNRYPSLK